MSDCVFVKGLVLHASHGVMQRSPPRSTTSASLSSGRATAARGAEDDRRRG
jgi:hypothetical protein